MSIPTFEELLSGLAEVDKKYRDGIDQRRNKDSKHKDNPFRFYLLSVLDVLYQQIKTLLAQNPDLPKWELNSICYGAWLFCIDSIYKEYKLLKPKSLLYKILGEELNSHDAGNLDPKEKIVHLEKFYNFIFNNQPGFTEIPTDTTALMQALVDTGVDTDWFKSQVIDIIKMNMRNLKTEVDVTVKAVPTENFIDTSMQSLYENYKKEKEIPKTSFLERYFNFNKENPERKFHAQLVQGIANIIAEEERLHKDTTNKNLSRSQRIKMGALLFIVQSIYNSYHVRSATHSALFSLARAILNVESLKEIDDLTKVVWITAFKNYLHENTLAKLEAYGEETFGEENLLNDIDPKIHHMIEEIESMIKTLIPANSNMTNWPATRTLSQLMAMILRAPFYGTGYVLGFSISETHTTVPSKVAMGNGINYLSTAILGFSRGYLGFLAADFIIQSTLTRAFAKVLEQMGMLVGYATGGAIGLGVDLSYKGLHQLCHGYLHLFDELYDPVLMKNVDPNFVKSLLRLPPDIFEEKKKNRLQRVFLEVPQPVSKKLIESDNNQPIRARGPGI